MRGELFVRPAAASSYHHSGNSRNPDLECSRLRRQPLFRAGTRTRGRGAFVSAKVPKTIPPERGSLKTATALRASLAAESGREAFPRLAAGAPPSLAAPLRADLARSSARLAHGCKT